MARSVARSGLKTRGHVMAVIAIADGTIPMNGAWSLHRGGAWFLHRGQVFVKDAAMGYITVIVAGLPCFSGD